MQPATSPQTAQQALSNYQSAQANIKDPTAVLTAREQALGVPGAVTQVGGLRQAITDTTNLLAKVAPGVQGRTQNSLVSNAQANRIIQNEQAPLQQNLQQTGQDYNSAQSDLERLLQQAQQQAQLEVSAEDRKIEGLKSVYGALYQKEQEERALQLEREKMAQQERLSKAASGGGISGLGGLGDTSGVGGKVGYQQKADKGFAFVDAAGNPISAAVYAKATNQNFRDLLKWMADRGDAGASAALGFVGNDYGYDPNKVNSAALASIYNNLVWGTGRNASAYNGNGAGAALTSLSGLSGGYTPAAKSTVNYTGGGGGGYTGYGR